MWNFVFWINSLHEIKCIWYQSEETLFTPPSVAMIIPINNWYWLPGHSRHHTPELQPNNWQCHFLTHYYNFVSLHLYSRKCFLKLVSIWVLLMTVLLYPFWTQEMNVRAIDIDIDTGTFSKDFFSQGAVIQVFLCLFH